jgi:flagellar biogenesis protein FliO
MTKEVEGLAGWILARLRASRRLRAAESREMNLLETLHLGGRRQLMLVECGGERFLVGGGAESVETIVQVSARPCAKEANGNEEYR